MYRGILTGAPDGVRNDPEDCKADDAIEDACVEVLRRLRMACNGERVVVGDECTAEVVGDGGFVDITLPPIRIRMMRCEHSALMSQWALDDALAVIAAAQRK